MIKKILLKIAKAWTFIKANSLLTFNEDHELYSVIWKRAVLDSAKWIEDNAANALIFKTKLGVHDYVINQLKDKNGTFLEFGVYKGDSINRFSAALPAISFIGFDSFEGLQEDWAGTGMAKGHFSTNGNLPKVNKNVILKKGWINETLPTLLSKKAIEDILCINIDVDTYETTLEIFQILDGKLPRKLYVLFDELLAYPNWRNGEYKALIESAKIYKFDFEFIAFGKHTALVEISFK